MKNVKVLALLLISVLSGSLFGMEVDVVPVKQVLYGRIYRIEEDIFYAQLKYHKENFGSRAIDIAIPVVPAKLVIYENQQARNDPHVIDGTYCGNHRATLGNNPLNSILLRNLLRGNAQDGYSLVQLGETVRQEYSNCILDLEVVGCGFSDRVEAFNNKLERDNIDKSVFDDLVTWKVVKEEVVNEKVVLGHGEESFLKKFGLLVESKSPIDLTLGAISGDGEKRLVSVRYKKDEAMIQEDFSLSVIQDKMGKNEALALKDGQSGVLSEEFKKSFVTSLNVFENKTLIKIKNNDSAVSTTCGHIELAKDCPVKRKKDGTWRVKINFFYDDQMTQIRHDIKYDYDTIFEIVNSGRGIIDGFIDQDKHEGIHRIDDKFVKEFHSAMWKARVQEFLVFGKKACVGIAGFAGIAYLMYYKSPQYGQGFMKYLSSFMRYLPGLRS